MTEPLIDHRRPEVDVARLVRVTYLMGAGIAPNDPVRRVDAYFDLNGFFVFEVDPFVFVPQFAVPPEGS